MSDNITYTVLKSIKKYRGWTMKLKHLAFEHNNLLIWCRASFCSQ